MPIKIYHPKRGFVLTNNNFEVDDLLAEGGKIVKKNREVDPIEPVKESTHSLIGDIDTLEVEPAPAVIKPQIKRKSRLI